MTACTWFASLVFAATIVHAPAAETHCPGNIASLPFSLVNGQQIVLAVSINHTGPYNFLLDSGTQISLSPRRFTLILRARAWSQASDPVSLFP